MKSDDKKKFNKLQQEQRDLDESYRQSLRNKIERQDLIDSLKLELKDNDTVLFKGSRGMKMEEIIEGVFGK